MVEKLTFKHILTPNGMLAAQTLTIEDGKISAIAPADTTSFDGYLAIPGMPNAHSHAFQRALSGYGEARQGDDSFWSWRQAMYRLANRITPDDCYTIARMAFADMLRGGYTSVAEFHYLHHLPDGTASPAMGEAVIAAANSVGLPITLLPVLYQTGGFNKFPAPDQARFVHKDIDSYCRLIEQLQKSGVALGIAPHSLRAVPIDVLPELLNASNELLPKGYPVHIHIAEQTAEVDACLTVHDKRPVELLMETLVPDASWNLVHATHITGDELQAIVSSHARIVICPITEAYLGDGLCPADDFVEAGGKLAVGSDSNCRLDALEELRLLEYGQRLRSQSRARFANGSGVGAELWQHTARAGAAAVNRCSGEITEGASADFVVFDENTAPLDGHTIATALDALLINASARDIAAVYVQGKRVIEHGQHELDNDIRRDFDTCVKKILGDL